VGTKPQDRQPKKPKKPKVLVLENGDRRVTLPQYTDAKGEPFVVDVLVEALDDFELLDKLGRMEEEVNPALVPGVIRTAVGEAGYERVMDVLRDEGSGRVSIGAGVEFFKALFGALNPKS
jgi:hypothetical protein